MKTKIIYTVLGVALAVSGSLIAATTNLPYQFTAGLKAKASEVNSNFSMLTQAVNGLDGRVSTLEQTSGTAAPIRFTTTQTDLPVGSTVIIGGITYTIVQFEVPRFDTDEVYLVKYPSSNNFTAGTASANEYIYATGSYSDLGNAASGWKEVTTLNGFDTNVLEYISQNTSMQVSNTGRSVTSSFSQAIMAQIVLNAQTQVSINFISSPSTLTGTNPTPSSDASGIITVYPPARTSAQRDIERQNLRTRLSYVTIKKKV